jgi:hypothetical protein
MATIILRDAGSISSPGSTAKGSPLTNLEVDNNFSNINLTTGVLSNLTNLGAGNVANLVVAINEVSANTGVTASTYGGAAVQTIITVNAKGKITSASNVTSTVANSNITGNIISSQITSVANSQITGNILITQIQPAGATAGVYGGPLAVPVLTVDYAGRLSAVSNATISADTFGLGSANNVSHRDITSSNTINTKRIVESVVAIGNTGTAATIDLGLGTVFTATLNGSATFTFANVGSVSSFVLILTNDGTGGRSVAWSGGTFKYPNGAVSRTTTASAIDIWYGFTPNSGTNWYISIPMAALA